MNNTQTKVVVAEPQEVVRSMRQMLRLANRRRNQQMVRDTDRDGD